MQARVRQTSRYGSCVAFSGREYVKYEWRPVTDGFEDEARRNPYLELDTNQAADDIKQPEAKVAPEVVKSPEILESPAEVKKTPGKKAIKAAE